MTCGVGSHCLGNQKVKVIVASGGNDLVERPTPKSTYVLGLSSKDCLKLQYSTSEVSDGGGSDSFNVYSDCTDPVMLDDGGYHVSCLSPPVIDTWWSYLGGSYHTVSLSKRSKSSQWVTSTGIR
jgi:hypothetical protein